MEPHSDTLPVAGTISTHSKSAAPAPSTTASAGHCFQETSRADSTLRRSSRFPPGVSPTFTLEPYGSGDLRLLKFLPDSRPVWEAPPARPNGHLQPDSSHVPPGADATAADSVQGARSGRKFTSLLWDRVARAHGLDAVQTGSSDSLVGGEGQSTFSLLDGSPETRRRRDGRSGRRSEESSPELERTGLCRRLPEYLYSSARAAASYPSLDLLQQAEALCLSADGAHQETLSQIDPWTRNKSVWESAVKERDQAAKWLAGGAMLFDLLLGSANAAPGQRFLKLVEARDEFSEEEAWQKLLIGLQGRHELARELQAQLHSALQAMIHELSGIQGQVAWLKLLRMLQELRWVLAKKRYQDVEFAQSDGSYPYIAEVYVHLLHLPSRCWGTGARSVCCSLPLPAPPAFVDHFVLVKARPQSAPRRKNKTREKQPESGKEAADSEKQARGSGGWGFVVEYDEAAGAFVETRSLLHISLKPLLSVLSSPLLPTASVVSPRFPAPSTRLPAPAGAFAGELSSGSAVGRARPDTVSHDENLERTARALHRRLQRAQWILLDRCCFQVLAAQAELRRVLGERPVGSASDDSKRGKVSGGHTTIDETTADDNWSRHSRHVTAECVQVAASGLKFLFRGVPVRRFAHQGPGVQALRTRSRPSGQRAGHVGQERPLESTGDHLAELSFQEASGTITCGKGCSVHTLDFVVEVTYAPTLQCNNSTEASLRPVPAPSVVAEDSQSEGVATWGTVTQDTGVNPMHERHDVATLDLLGGRVPGSAPAGASVWQRCSTCGCCMVSLPHGIEGLIEQMQGVAVLELRQLFLEAWAHEAFDQPRLLADLGLEPPLHSRVATQERERRRGVDLLETFLLWLATEGLQLGVGSSA